MSPRLNSIQLIQILILGIMVYPSRLLTQDSIPSVFGFRKWTDISLVSSGVASNATAGLLYLQTTPLSINEIQQLDANNLAKVDYRVVFNPVHSNAGLTSDLLMYSSFVAPLFLLGEGIKRKELAVLGTMALESFMITNGLTWLGKTIAERPRPYMYVPTTSPESKQSKNGIYSYVSGHTSSTACLYFFTARVIHDYSNNYLIKSLAWTIAVTIPALTGYYRTRAKQHFAGDVVRGYLIGALAGIIIPELHKHKKSGSAFRIEVSPYSIGLSYFPK